MKEKNVAVKSEVAQAVSEFFISCEDILMTRVTMGDLSVVIVLVPRWEEKDLLEKEGRHGIQISKKKKNTDQINIYEDLI